MFKICKNLILPILSILNLKLSAETYTDLKIIVDSNCTKCHNADGIADFLPLETFAEIKPVAKKLSAALSSGKMPKDNTGFKDTSDGKRLLSWLTTGEDIFGPPPTQCPPPPPEHLLMKDPRDLTYAMISPIIKIICTGCHNPSGQASRYPFQTFEQVADRATGMLKQLSKQKMPRGNPEFRFSQDGRALMGWLESGKDLTGGDLGGGVDD